MIRIKSSTFLQSDEVKFYSNVMRKVGVVAQPKHNTCTLSQSFGKVRHNSRIESWLGCIKGALLVVLCTKSSILIAGAGVWKISYVTCWFNSIKIDYFDNPKV